jgi:hypothetical protein
MALLKRKVSLIGTLREPASPSNAEIEAFGLFPSHDLSGSLGSSKNAR